MIPLRDNAAPARLTLVNAILIAVNLAVFNYEVTLGPRATGFVDKFAMVPSLVAGSISAHPVAAASRAALSPVITIFTSMFLHGSIWHLAGNLLYLFIFGAAVEYAMGPARYLGFYLAAGVAAALATVWISPDSSVPVIGASGAIAGVLGAYFVLFPRGRILTALPIFLFIQFVEVPALLFLLLWFAVQLYAGIVEGNRGQMIGGVAWWAHIGGFLFGIAMAPMLAHRRSRRRRAR